MGIKDWLNRKGEEKSASNIVDDLRKLAVVVREDIEQGLVEADRVIGRQKTDEIERSKLRERLTYRKAAVTEAQKRFYKNLTTWSTLSPERVWTEVVLPAIDGRTLMKASESSFEPFVVAIYRVCESAAQQRGQSLRAHTPRIILEVVNKWGDLYK